MARTSPLLETDCSNSLERLERLERPISAPQPPAHRTPATAQEWVEAALAELRLAPSIIALPEVVTWIKRQPTNPGITQGQLAGALERLQREDREAEQPDLFGGVA